MPRHCGSLFTVPASTPTPQVSPHGSQGALCKMKISFCPPAAVSPAPGFPLLSGPGSCCPAQHRCRPSILTFPHCIQPLGLCPHRSVPGMLFPQLSACFLFLFRGSLLLLKEALPHFSAGADPPPLSSPHLLCGSYLSSHWTVCGGQMGVNTRLPKRLACVAHVLNE